MPKTANNSCIAKTRANTGSKYKSKTILSYVKSLWSENDIVLVQTSMTNSTISKLGKAGEVWTYLKDNLKLRILFYLRSIRVELDFK